MKELTRIQEQALEFIEVYLKATKVHDKALKAMKEGYDDFHPYFPLMPSNLEVVVVKMLDEMLEHGGSEYENGGLASYYIWECSIMKGGGSIVVDDKTYRIKTLNDLRKYLVAMNKKGDNEL